MGLITRILNIKQKEKNVVVKDGKYSGNEELIMHMIYRDGESDAEYELENDDYKEVPPLETKIASGEELKTMKEKIKLELKVTSEIVESELNQ